MDDRTSNDSDPGGTPEESSADEGDVAYDTKLLSSAFGHASTYYTCSSIGDVLVTADHAVDPVPIPKNARAALKDKVYADNSSGSWRWRLR